MKKLITILTILFLSDTLIAQWVYHGELAYPRSSTRAVSKDNKVYVIGGRIFLVATNQAARSQTMDIIDEGANTISNIQLPGPKQKEWPAIAAGDKGIYMMGGRDNSGQMSNEAFRYVNDAWEVIDTMPKPYALGADVVKVGSKLIVGGGYIPNGYHSEIYIYDETTEKWSVENISTKRHDYGVATDGNKVYFAGGFDTSDLVTNLIDIWDINSNTWTTDTLSVARAGVTGAFFDDKVFFAGGWYNGKSNSSDVVDIFDGSSWSTINLIEARGITQKAILGDKLFFVGGADFDDVIFDVISSSSQVDIYDKVTDNWISPVKTLIPRNLSGVAATDNFVYAAGGLEISNGTPTGFINTVEKYSISTGFEVLDLSKSINIYPNPSNGHFTIDGLIEETDYQVFDQLGRMMKSGRLTFTDNMLDLTNLQKGHYYLRFAEHTKVLIIH